MNKIAVSQPVLGGNELRYATECITTGQLSYGTFNVRLEALWAERCGVPHGLTVCNGTAALHLLLLALGVRPGDEVIVPDLTFIATANAVTYCGAKPIFADVNPYTWTLDADNLSELIRPSTKGIIAVHLYGQPCDMDAINAVAQRHGLWVIEDAAEAMGATYKGRPVGALADAAIFSLYGNKMLTAGEGGMVTTHYSSLVERMRHLRGQGMSVARYVHTVVGYNYRMTNVQAAIALAQIEQMDWHLTVRRMVYDRYTALLKDRVSLQHRPDWSTHSAWMFNAVLHTPEIRERVERGLREDGIETRPVFVPMTQQPIYANGTYNGVSRSLGARGLSLPTHAAMKPEDVDRVCSRVIHHAEGAH